MNCHDCARPYGDENGFPDLIIPFWAWKRISYTRDDGGLLCPSCICKRLHDRGIKCEGAFMSGPIISVSQVTMSNLRRVENTELNTENSSSTQEDGRPVVKMWIVEYEENGRCWRTVVEHYTREEAMSYFEQEWPNVKIRECY